MPRALRLIRPLERALYAGHPWIYRDALAPFEADAGELVDVFDKRGRLIARGLVDDGPIGVRVFSTLPKERVDRALFEQRIAAAFALRARALPPETDAYRLLHGEGDRFPGVVCDRYGAHAVLKLDGAGVLALRDELTELLRAPLAELGVRGLLVRTSRKSKRALARASELIQGAEVELAWGDPPPAEVEVRERGMRLLANLWQGQKTGLFLDHRESRARVRTLARELAVLNLYGYTGGFSLAAALGGAREVTTVDVARPALELAVQTFARNQLAAFPHHTCAEDVPAFLARAAESGQRYDLVVADPPNFAPSQAKLEAALESYAALHASALGLLPPGGFYLAASCSSHVRVSDFLESLREGARRARRVLAILEQTGAPFDHPRLLAFPEGDYLKVVLTQVA